MANRYNDQDYPRYNERDDRYDSRSEFRDSEQRNRNYGGGGGHGARGNEHDEGYYGMSLNRNFGSDFGRGNNQQDRDHDDFQSNARTSRSHTGGFDRNSDNDRSDYTLYGYDRDNQYSSGSDQERGYYNRGGDYGYGSNFGSSGSNFDRMDASDYTRGGSRDYGRGSGRDRSHFGREGNYGQGGGYSGDYMNSERGWETENRGGSNQSDRGWWDKTSDEISSWFGDDEAARRREMDMRQGGGGQTSYRGKGPKNYRRSDERIREDINDRLTDYPYLDASDIEVEVNNGGEVILSGTVESRYAKRMAEDITEDISGVTNVENRLRVRQNTSNFSSTGTGNFSSGDANTGITNSSTGGNLTTGGTTGMTGALTDISTGTTTDTSLGTSTSANNSTTGNTSTGNTGDTNTTSTGRARSKSA
ncbi:MAG: BON domain-containing protein [Acidobacteriota bacterium]|nr:BON domain-containing protein [Acidobacteriota bacterium]